MGLRITKVYTRTGDKGTTRLGGGQEVPKDSLRIQTYGMVDELNSVIGLALAFEPVEAVHKALVQIQHELFTLGGDLCLLEEDKQKWGTPGIEPAHVKQLEELMDRLNQELEPLEEFILPGGSTVSAFLHQARCVCRRAESLAVALAREEKIGANVLPYLNRLSDALFVLARYQNHQSGVDDVFWRKPKP